MKPRDHIPQEEMFPFVEMEKLVPDNHILRLIDRYVDFSFIHELTDHTYSEVTGRPAVDPELMIRILVIGYLNNLSERKLFEELRMHAAYRWFCNLGFYESTPDRSTLNKLRNHRWTRDGIFERIMQRIVRQCVEAGLVKGGHVTVDGTKIEANASIKSLEPVEIEVALDDYLGDLRLKRSKHSPRDDATHLHDKDFHGETFSNATHRSTTDPDARLFKKAEGQEASLSYVGNVLIDTKSRVILATAVTQPGITTESDAALAILDALPDTHQVTTLAADKGYGNTEFVTEMLDRGITPHVPLLAKSDYEPTPSWKTAARSLERKEKRAKKIKQVSARNRVRDINATVSYKQSQHNRKRIEHIFAEAKNYHGLDRARGRRLQAVSQQLTMTGVVQNCKRLVNFRLRLDRKASETLLLGQNALSNTLLSLSIGLVRLMQHFKSFLRPLSCKFSTDVSFFKATFSPDF